MTLPFEDASKIDAPLVEAANTEFNAIVLS
jgi:hypothetical protein